MPRRTPGFKGLRLREARLARNMQASVVADLLGLSRQRIYSYENGSATPPPDIVDSIANLLKVPVELLLDPSPGKNDSTTFFRSLSAATKLSQDRASVFVKWFDEIINFLSEYVVFPELDIPNYELPNDPLKISMEDIEEVAESLRDYWGINNNPIGNTISLVEAKGCFVQRLNLDAVTLDGLSQISTLGRPLITLNMEKSSAVRSRFDCLHELGHFILHHNVKPDMYRNMKMFRLIEDQAHRFSAAFLIPATSYLNEVIAPDLDMFLAMKRRWKVSVGMLIKRGSDLACFPEERIEKLWKNYSWRRWRRREPFDDDIKPEEPAIVRNGFDVVLREGIQTVPDILAQLPFGAEMIERLSNLPKGRLNEKEGIIVRLKNDNNETINNNNNKNADVIQFSKNWKKK